MYSKSSVFSQAEKLAELGVRLHWLHKESKKPVSRNWSSFEFSPWVKIKKEYKPGLNLGAVLGKASQLYGTDGFLANIDVDIKSGTQDDRDEALAALKEIFPSLDLESCPAIKTGLGIRYMIQTPEPAVSKNIARSEGVSIVFMPSEPINDKQLGYLEDGEVTRAELDNGYRVRPSWEIDLMGQGKQIVLPPSIHPSTKKCYEWLIEPYMPEDIPFVDVSGIASTSKKKTTTTRKDANDFIANFKPSKIRLKDLKHKLPESLYRLLKTGKTAEGKRVRDRSDSMFSACLSLLRLGVSDTDIFTLFTEHERSFFSTPYTHYDKDGDAVGSFASVGHKHALADGDGVATDDDARRWVYRYVLEPAKKELSTASEFEPIPDEDETLEKELMPKHKSKEKAKQKAKELTNKSWKASLTFTAKGYEPTISNVIAIIENVIAPKAFVFDQFAQAIYVNAKVPWARVEDSKLLRDEDAISLMAYLDKEWKISFGKGACFDAIQEIASRNTFNSAKDFFETLPEWDGVERIPGALQKYFNAEGEKLYIDTVFHKWLQAAIRRVYSPGTPFDWMPLLMGPGRQGLGKSKFSSVLFGDLYYEGYQNNPRDRDAVVNILGSLVVEMGELASLTRADLEAAKNFISRPFDKIRLPYGRAVVNLPRRCIFIGTSDKETPLKDKAGNRRFMPIHVGQLDFEGLRAVREQLLAEALFKYHVNPDEPLYVEGDVKVMAEAAQRAEVQANESDIIYADVLNYIIEHQDDTEKMKGFERFGVLDLATGNGFQEPITQVRVRSETAFMMFAADALRKLGAKHWKSQGLMKWYLDVSALLESNYSEG